MRIRHCEDCDGTGRHKPNRLTVAGSAYYDIPDVYPCTRCKGTGHILTVRRIRRGPLILGGIL